MTVFGNDSTPLTEALVREALAHGTAQQRPIDWLARTLALPADEFVRLAASHFGLEAMPMERLRTFEPDFELVSYVEATQRACVALQGDDATVLVLSDPLDTRTR